jgi:hypothetical protein
MTEEVRAGEGMGMTEDGEREGSPTTTDNVDGETPEEGADGKTGREGSREVTDAVVGDAELLQRRKKVKRDRMRKKEGTDVPAEAVRTRDRRFGPSRGRGSSRSRRAVEKRRVRG